MNSNIMFFATGADNATTVVNGAANVFFAPLTLILYQLLVVWPNQIIYWFLDIIQKITGFNNGGLNDTLLASDSGITKIMLAFIGIGVVLGIISFIAGYVKIVTSQKQDQKTQIFNLVKRVGFAVIVSTLLPMLFYTVSLLLNTIFSSGFNKIIDIATQKNQIGRLNNTPQNEYEIILKALNEGSSSSYQTMNRLFVFNTWTLGYSGKWIKDGQLDRSIVHVINSIKSFDTEESSDVLRNFFAADSIGNWNIFLSGISSLVFLFGIITFVINVIARLLWVYILMMVSPLILGGGVVMEKNTAKFTVDFIQKLLITQAAVLGYFLFSALYSIITTSLNTTNIFNTSWTSMTNRLFQFSILFAGISLINQIPVALLKYFNSNEQLIGNEMQEARSQINRITQPLQSAFSGTVHAVSGLSRSIGQNTGSSLNTLKLNTPATLK